MNALHLFLLGSPRLESNGHLIRFGRRNALALLAILSVDRNPCSRSVLINLLWPDASPKQGLAHLRNTLYELNRTPVATHLAVDRSMIRLVESDCFRIDAVEFQQINTHVRQHHTDDSTICPICRDQLMTAVSLFQGNFMSGFYIPESSEFEHWMTLQAERFSNDIRRMLNILIEYHSKRGHWDRAIELAEQSLSLDMSNEEIHRKLIWIYAQMGRLRDATRQFERCRVILRDELGVQPSSDTIALYRQIRSGISLTQTISIKKYSLPTHPAPFVGRHHEIEQICGLLKHPDVRLVTLTGMGGCGKTRLALQCGNNIQTTYENGAVWIDLAPLTSSEFVLSALCDALELRTSREQQLIASLAKNEMTDVRRNGHRFMLSNLIEFLRTKHLLLILDNAEHLMDGLTFIPDILKLAPDIQFLVTSRERLKLEAEWVIELHGMAYPTETRDAGDTDYESMTFFLQIARRVSDRFTCTKTVTSDIARICRLVSGIPLAIELAASWVTVLSCRDIAREIETGIDFLVSRRKDIPDRHRTMRAVFDYSWKQMSPHEQRHLRHLSLLRGGFNRDSAREAAGVGLAELSALVDKSILRKRSDDRFELHELLRQYALGFLAENSNELAHAEQRHAECFLSMLHGMESRLQGHDQKLALREISSEIDNIRSAWHWAIDHGNVSRLNDACLALFLYFDLRTQYQDGNLLFSYAWQRSPEAELSEARLRFVNLCKGFDAWFMRYNNPPEARRMLTEALVELEPCRTTQEWAITLDLYHFLGGHEDRVATLAALNDAEKIFRDHRNDWGVAMNLEAIANQLLLTDLTAAKNAIQNSLDVRRHIGDRWGIAMSLEMLGRIEEEEGHDSMAESDYSASLSIRRELEADLGGMINCLQGLGRLALRRQALEDAGKHYQEALELAQQTVNHQRIAEVSWRLGTIAKAQNEMQLARNYLSESMRLFMILNEPDSVSAISSTLEEISRQGD